MKLMIELKENLSNSIPCAQAAREKNVSRVTASINGKKLKITVSGIKDNNN